MRLPKSIPKAMPNNWVLKQLAFPPDPSFYYPQKTLDGLTLPPRISFRNQQRLRKACDLAGLDASTLLSLPDVIPRETLVREKQEKQKMHIKKIVEERMRGYPFTEEEIAAETELRVAMIARKVAAKPNLRLPRGDGREIRQFERSQKIKENMAKMDERIATWKQEKAKLKQASKPDMPF